MPPRGAARVRRSVRRRGRRVADAAVDRYRDAVIDRSRWLPAYLAAADVAGAALRLRHGPPPVAVISAGPAGSRGFGRDHRREGPAAPVVVRAAVSDDVLSFVLAGAYGWRNTVRGVALDRGGERHVLPDALLHATAGVIRVNVTLPADRGTDAVVVLLDADGVALDLPTPPVAEPSRG